MPRVSTVKKISHTVTTADELSFFFTLPLLWDAPFDDTKYAVSCNVETVFSSGGNVGGYLVLTNLTRFGFTAMITNSWNVGDKIVLHASASRIG